MYQTDVLIIGAGAVGVALARELSKYRLRVMICDKNDDVGGDASKSCSSCVATQATMPTGSLEHMLRAVSHPMVYQLCEDLDVPINRCGSLTIAITPRQQAGIAAWMAKAYANGVYDAEVLTRQELLELEPHLNPELLGGIYVPRDGQINQFLFVVAQAENAAENGVEFLLDCPVLDIEASDKGIQRVVTAKGDIQAKWVINAAGLHCDDIARMVGLCDFSVHPRKGEFFVLGHDTPVKVSHISSPRRVISRESSRRTVDFFIFLLPQKAEKSCSPSKSAAARFISSRSSCSGRIVTKRRWKTQGVSLFQIR